MSETSENKKDNSGKLSVGEMLCYGSGDCAANVYVAMSGLLTGYYTDTVGIAAAAVGTMMVVARVFDGVSDLGMGAIVDRTKSRWGKARPWVLWTAPFMAIGLILLFGVPTSLYNTSGALVWAYVTYILMNAVIYTANNLPYNALLSRMTLNVQVRATTTSIRFVMTQVVTLIISSITANLVTIVGWTPLAVIYGIVEIIMLLICFFGCKEHIGEEADTGQVKVENVPLSKSLPALLKNKYFYMQALAFLILYVRVANVGTLGYYFCDTVLGSLAFYTMVSACQTIPAIVANFVNPYLVGRFGKRRVMIVSCIIMGLGGIVVGLADTNIVGVAIGLIMMGLGNGPISSGMFALTADVVDYGEWKTGIRSEGLVNSCTSFGMKVGIGLGSALGSAVLTMGGYNGLAATQTAEAVSAIKFGFGYLNTILAVGLLILLFLINIDKDIKTIQSDLEAKHEAEGLEV